MFKRKKKKTGCETPEYSYFSMAPGPKPEYTFPNPCYIPPASVKSVKVVCVYETPCGWCTKWDKKCDKKIGGYPTVSDQVQKKVVFERSPAPACSDCIHFTSISSICSDCGAGNDYKHFKAKEN